MKKNKFILSFLVLVLTSNFLFAQEIVVPLKYNSALSNVKTEIKKQKKTRATLPFIDDFSYVGPYPDPNLWVDNQAFINNTMCVNPITQGVATLDGLNANGRPYFTNPNSIGYADSLTSQPINLSGYNPSNNIFISFFYQPQGLGFAPESKDSLILYLKNDQNVWVDIWKIRGTGLQSFRYVTLPINDPQFLHANFQFRFVNIASLDLNNDTWNIDYVKIDQNRSYADSINNDIAFTNLPSSILSPYSSLPYRHFLANQTNEKMGTHTVDIKNLYPNNQQVTVQHTATELLSTTSINTSILPSTTAFGYSNLNQNFTTYNVSYNAPTNKSKVVIQNKYFYNAVNSQDRKDNDTITRDIVFDNYFAYDDGSAEKSYFLLPAFNFPAKTALEFHLNEPDTIRGMMVHFGPQLPTAAGKKFSIVLYKTLAGTGINDSIILQQDLNEVMYENAIDGFSSYGFAQPKLLDAGTYYIGITQPANFGSDSIYYGLDVNNNTNLQHLYYNVNGTWYASLTEGSVMMRPIVGQVITPTVVSNYQYHTNLIEIYPNPCAEKMIFNSKIKIKKAKIFSLLGNLILESEIENNEMNLNGLSSGIYVVSAIDEEGNNYNQKINKL